MNLQALSEALFQNQTLVGKDKVSINIETLSLKEQKEALSFFQGGKVCLWVCPPESSMKKTLVHISLKKGGLEVNVGAVHLPALSDKEEHSSGLEKLFKEAFSDFLSPTSSETLKRNNGSMILYSLKLFPDMERYYVENAYEIYKKKIPLAYDTAEKILNTMDFKSMERFRVA